MSSSNSESSGSSGKKDEEMSTKLEQLLKMLAAGGTLSEEQKKEMKDYKFWKTQPVPKFDETIDNEGPIDVKSVKDIPTNPLPLLSDFEWATMDLSSNQDMEDIFTLLHENYVEDKDSTFRFNYSKQFFNYALKPPGWKEEWNVGVRVKASGKLIAFISGIPATLNVRGKSIKAVEINFLCVHKKLRSKRLTPVLIKEITRRVNLHDIWQALYTSGTVLPTPLSTCRYNHRPLNWSKLYEVGFSPLPAGMTKSKMVAKYALPNTTSLKGLRPMEEADLPQVQELFEKYSARFELNQTFSAEEFKHWMLGSKDNTEKENKKFLCSYVVADDSGHVTDFFSFYLLPFQVLDNSVHKDIEIAYLFYYATETALTPEKGTDADLTARLRALINDALIIAKTDYKCDVFNALSSQDNCRFLGDLKFGVGDGFLNYYLFNYKAFPVAGGLRPDKSIDVENGSKVNVVMF